MGGMAFAGRTAGAESVAEIHWGEPLHRPPEKGNNLA